MTQPLKRGFAALVVAAMAAAPVTVAVGAATVLGADAAFAKSDNGKGNGNGGGNGGGKGNAGGNSGKGGGNSASSKSASASGSTGSSSATTKNGRTVTRVVEKKVRTKDGRVKTVRTIYVSKGKAAQPAARTKAAPQTASVTTETATTETATAETTKQKGGGWRSRMAAGQTRVPPQELGMWNSAKRSPQAIANMAEKYRETGKITGAGGAIGALVVAYEDMNAAVNGEEGLTSAVQAALDAGEITMEQAEAILSGDLPTAEQLAEQAAALGESYELPEGVTLTYEGGVVGCDDGGSGGCDDVLTGADYADVQAEIAEIEGAAGVLDNEAIADAMEAVEAADTQLADAQALVQPNKTPELAEDMLADVEELLGISLEEPNEVTAPEPAPTEEAAVTGEEGAGEGEVLPPEEQL